MNEIITIGVYFLIAVFFVSALFSSVVFTPENHYSFITVFGKYEKTVASGISFKAPFISSVDKRIFLGLSSRNIPLTLKTLDQVTFNLALNVQYVVSNKPEEAFKALYHISDFKLEMDNVATNSAIPLGYISLAAIKKVIPLAL